MHRAPARRGTAAEPGAAVLPPRTRCGPCCMAMRCPESAAAKPLLPAQDSFLLPESCHTRHAHHRSASLGLCRGNPSFNTCSELQQGAGMYTDTEIEPVCLAPLPRRSLPSCTAVTPEPCVQADNPGRQLSSALDSRDEAIVPNLMLLKEGKHLQPVRKTE